MIRKSIALLSIAFLAGCQLPHDPVQPAVEVEISPQTPEDPDVVLWLESRKNLCALPEVEQRARIHQLANNTSVTRNEAIEHILLATCQPDLTPGLLREALSTLPDTSKWSPAERAFVELIGNFTRSYRILEDKNRQLADQLEDTINGIRAIETELDNVETVE